MAITSATDDDVSIFELRRAARRRAWICPGAGYDLFGRRTSAAATYVAAVVATLAAVVAAVQPSAGRIGATLGLIALSTFVWGVEISATFSLWPTRPASAARAAEVRYRLGAVLLWGAAMLTAAIVLLSYRVLIVGGIGMSPVLHEGDRVLFQRRVDDDRLQRGRTVLFRLGEGNKFTEPGTPMIGRIAAMPGDRLSVRDDLYYVNGRAEHHVAPADPYPIAVEVPRYPESIAVPPGCFFILQDSPERGLDSRVLSWAHYYDLESTRMFSLELRSPFQRIE